MMIFINIIKSLLIAYFITRFQPFQDFIYNLKLKRNNPITRLIYEFLSCLKCMSFWTALIITHNFYFSVITFIIGFIYDKKFSSWEKKITLNK